LKPIRAAIFVRVSTTNQDTENQLLDLNNIINTRGYELVKTYRSNVSAYHHKSTKYLQELKEDARRGLFKILIIWALDRLSRLGMEKTLSVVREFNDYGVKIVSYQESWLEEQTDPMARDMFIGFAGWVAKQEAKRRSERIIAANNKARAEGKAVGRKKGAKDKAKRKTEGYRGNQNYKGGAELVDIP